MRVVVLDDIDSVGPTCPEWGQLGQVDVQFHSDPCSDDDLVERLTYADVVVMSGDRTFLGGPLLERLPGIQLIITPDGAGAVDEASAIELGMFVSWTTTGVSSVGAERVDRIGLRGHFVQAVEIIAAFRAT